MVTGAFHSPPVMIDVEAATQGVTMGEDTVLGLLSADDFVGILETPEGSQKQIEKALKYTINIIGNAE